MARVKALSLIIIYSILASILLGGLILFAPAESAESKKDFNLSRSFLGAYKKTMRFEEQIEKHTEKYDIDPVLVWAIAMYESGGNENLNSHVGAKKLMQVMKSTKKAMGIKGDDIDANIEAGVKYLAYLKKIFNRKDRGASRLKSLMIMGYNGGEGRVKRGLVKIETYQYLQGVSIYYNLLSQRFNEIKEASKGVDLLVLDKKISWEELSQKLGVSVLELRLFNPFLAHRYKKAIPKKQAVSYPKVAGGIFYEVVLAEDNKVKKLFYKVKPGDILHHVCNSFSFSYDDMRDREGMLLWGSLQPGNKVDVTDSPYLSKKKK